MDAQTGNEVHEFVITDDSESRCLKCGKTFMQAILNPSCSGTKEPEQVEESDEQEYKCPEPKALPQNAIVVEPILYQENFIRSAPTNECPTCGQEHPTQISPKCHPMSPMFVSWDADRNCLIMECSVCQANVAHVCVAEAAYERWKALELEDEDEDGPDNNQ